MLVNIVHSPTYLLVHNSRAEGTKIVANNPTKESGDIFCIATDSSTRSAITQQGSQSSIKDSYLAKEAMRICDESMSFLVGSQLSVGTLKSIANSIQEDGPERMPGYCCMDDATNSEFWGYDVS